MNDAEFLAAFENCLLPFEEWTHRAHVRVAYLYCCQGDLKSATDRMRVAIKAYNKATGTPEALDRGYHETITRAFMTLVFAANVDTGPHGSSDDFCETHPELMTKQALLRYYSREGIMSWDAKAKFIEPDLCPLPRIVESLPANELRDFLAASDVINWQEQCITDLAASLSEGIHDDEEIAKRLFEWVRDNIEHTGDFGRSEVTCRASDVLRVGTGFCYAKSHLLAALLRANRIPCGFSYQRLSISGDGPPYCLHGLNAVYLKRHGWYRIDPRGNTETLHAEFSPPTEKVAFQASFNGEADLPDIRPEPLNCVIAALTSAQTAELLAANLPDTTPTECP